MRFTALHRLLGLQPGPLTVEIVEQAVSSALRETEDLDWKRALPPAKGLTGSDFPKDVAAMANSGGGVIVYGVAEEEKAAVKQVDAGELTETHERALRSAAITAISPPVFGLSVDVIGEDPLRTVVVEIPASLDGPHLIYRDGYFGAPVRNDADTVWMKEPEIAARYRARFEERSNAHTALDNLYEDAATRRTGDRAWFIGVARPRIVTLPRQRMDRDAARAFFTPLTERANHFTTGAWRRPVDALDINNPRPGLRRWIAPPDQYSLGSWHEAWASLHDDGSLTFAAAIGGHPTGSNSVAAGHEVRSDAVELCAIALMAVCRMASEHFGTADYELKAGIEWGGQEPLTITAPAAEFHRWTPPGLPVARYAPVLATVRPTTDESEYLDQIRDLATDLVNQGGLSALVAVPTALR